MPISAKKPDRRRPPAAGFALLFLAAALLFPPPAGAWTLELGFAPRDNIIPPRADYAETTLAVISSDREIVGLEKSDIVVENGEALAWRRRNPKLYDLQIRCADAPGAVMVTVPAGCCTDADGTPLAGDVTAKLPIAWAPWAADVKRSHFVVRNRWAPTASLLLSEPGDPVVAMEFTWISPGTWWMGSRGPEAGPNADPSHKPNETRHQVTLTKGFWIATAECAQAQWKAVMDSAPSVFPRSGEEDVHPVDSVSWNDAMAFAAAVNARHPGLGMTLPTEAQWEYACRAETTTAFYSGPNDIRGDANSKHLDVIGWYAGNSAAWKGSGKTPETAPANAADLSAEFSDFLFGPPEFTRFAPHRVGNHAKNDWGLKDFSGNLAEWCADVYAEDLGASDATDPFTDAGGALRVVRGGSWRSAAADCRSCARSGLAPDTARDDLGFRPIIPGDATP